MGSGQELPPILEAAHILVMFLIQFELRFVSAHCTPERLMEYVQSGSTTVQGDSSWHRLRGTSPSYGCKDGCFEDDVARVTPPVMYITLYSLSIPVPFTSRAAAFPNKTLR